MVTLSSRINLIKLRGFADPNSKF